MVLSNLRHGVMLVRFGTRVRVSHNSRPEQGDALGGSYQLLYTSHRCDTRVGQTVESKEREAREVVLTPAH
jgi:hypothetical protein